MQVCAGLSTHTQEAPVLSRLSNDAAAAAAAVNHDDDDQQAFNIKPFYFIDSLFAQLNKPNKQALNITLQVNALDIVISFL